jgi:DNA polymerase III sliding clamp (beta) subunit (PCNA family)
MAALKKGQNMETLTKTMQEITLDANAAKDLFTGAAIAADSDKARPSLNSIALSAADGELRIVATDRYRLIAGSMAYADNDAILDQIMIPLDGAKRIISTLKDLPKRLHVKPTLTLTRAGDILTAAISAGPDNSSTITISLNARGETTFPPYEHLFPTDSVAMDGISFNPALLADFAKVPNNLAKGSQLIVTLHGDKKPVSVKIPHDLIQWRGLLMPMRVN